jgi:hypothetical protein
MYQSDPGQTFQFFDIACITGAQPGLGFRIHAGTLRGCERTVKHPQNEG